ncbi:MAG: hypothetical protein IM674_02785 [Brevundimonas sp.]|nr:hypothetical protein [Brevundimonas sp.]
MRSLTFSECELVVGGQETGSDPGPTTGGDTTPVPSWNDTTHYVQDSQGRYHLSPEWENRVNQGWDIDVGGVVTDFIQIGLGGLLGMGATTVLRGIGSAVLAAADAQEDLEDANQDRTP